jgi:hypothetical protein
MQIGRRIYYELATGNVIQDTGEREGSVVETTTEQDFASYASLAERVPATVGVIELEFRELAQDFVECNGYIVVAVNVPFIDSATTSDDLTTYVLVDADLRFGSIYEVVKLNGETVYEEDYMINPNGRVTFLESVEGEVTISGSKQFSLEFSYPDPSDPEAPPVYQAPLSIVVAQLKESNLDTMSALADVFEMVLALQP